MKKVRREIDPAKTALIVIDMQNDFLDPASPLVAKGGLEFIPRFNEVIAEARRQNMLLIFSASTYRHGENFGRLGDHFPDLYTTDTLKEGKPGWCIHDDVDFREGDILIKKPRYSVFWQTNLEQILQDNEIDTLILGGVWSNVCVESTARDAFFREYKVICLSDCVATGDLPDLGHGTVPAEEVNRATLADIAMHICETATAADVLERLRTAQRHTA